MRFWDEEGVAYWHDFATGREARASPQHQAIAAATIQRYWRWRCWRTALLAAAEYARAEDAALIRCNRCATTIQCYWRGGRVRRTHRRRAELVRRTQAAARVQKRVRGMQQRRRWDGQPGRPGMREALLREELARLRVRPLRGPTTTLIVFAARGQRRGAVCMSWHTGNFVLEVRADRDAHAQAGVAPPARANGGQLTMRVLQRVAARIGQPRPVPSQLTQCATHTRATTRSMQPVQTPHKRTRHAPRVFVAA